MDMDADEPSPITLRDQYTIVKKQNGRGTVKCNHCGKDVNNSHRLKSHLGGVRGDVLPCPSVPEDIREFFHRQVLLKKSECIVRKSVMFEYSNPPRLRSRKKLSPSSNCFQQPKPKKSARKVAVADGKEDLPSNQTKTIQNFSHQGLVDLKVDNSPCLKQTMVSSIGEGKSQFNNMPSYKDLINRQMLKVKLKAMQGYVDDVKQSWSSTGCSILVDGWRNEEGRDLVTFLADCPRGPIYLHSSDVSSLNGNVDALYSMLTEVVEEIGEHNVVQVIACSIEGWMATLGEQFMKKCRSVFWSTSASRCINLILEKIGRLEHVKVILEKAKSLLEFIEIKPSNMKSAIPFETLEDIVSERNKLEAMCNDRSFWTGATMVVKATMPLVHVLALVHGADKLLVGYIYETMDQAKETIREELKNDESYYTSFWEIIDEIWDNYLHSPLHAAGYYLNPSLFYSSDFHVDAEVSFGLLCCIVRMVQDLQTQDLISMQLDDYRLGKGAFGEGSTVDRRSIPPLEWWTKYGGECPELQKFATRVLSQTCDGASRYGLRRQMAEKLLKSGTKLSCSKQSEFHDLTFVHYNLQLKYLNSGMVMDGCSSWEELDLMDDWMVSAEQP